MTTATLKNSRHAAIALWSIQILLAALFLFAGGMKLVMPIAAMTQQTPLPGFVLRLIGVIEFAGGLGLVLPGLLHLRSVLTPLAAVGLVLVMSGAVAITLTTPNAASAIAPLIVGVLLVVVALGRLVIPTSTVRRAY